MGLTELVLLGAGAGLGYWFTKHKLASGRWF